MDQTIQTNVVSQTLYLQASDISVTRDPNNPMMVIDLRMMSTQPNNNGEGVTEAFIDSVIANAEMLCGIPLYADVDNLTAWKFDQLTHMYDKLTLTYGTTMIGSFITFKKVNDQYGVSLYGQARIPKREKQICDAVLELYRLGMLNFSCEIKYVYPSGVIRVGDVMYIDANPQNVLTGMCVVTHPAFDEATALDLVAEQKADDKEVSQPMENENMQTVAEEVNQNAEVATAETAEVNAEVVEATAETVEATAENANAETVEATAEAPIVPEQPEDHDEPDDVNEPEDNDEDELTRAMNQISEQQNRICELEAQLATLNQLQAELEALRAEKAALELAERVGKARLFAEKSGLDLNAEKVAEAVNSANFELLAEMNLETKPDEQVGMLVSEMTLPDAKLNNPVSAMVKNVIY